jgi:hypothetical protein
MDEIQFFFDADHHTFDFGNTNATLSPESVSFDGGAYTYTPAALLSDSQRMTGESAFTY